jgi:hypothetical protein
MATIICVEVALAERPLVLPFLGGLIEAHVSYSITITTSLVFASHAQHVRGFSRSSTGSNSAQWSSAWKPGGGSYLSPSRNMDLV